ncbi:MAG: D-cysteine desulfhydrase, partial [Pyrinomonadaceae bacterium]
MRLVCAAVRLPWWMSTSDPDTGWRLQSQSSLSKLLAANEGIVLDPVYTAKAMAALLDWIRKGKLTERDTVLF